MHVGRPVLLKTLEVTSMLWVDHKPAYMWWPQHGHHSGKHIMESSDGQHQNGSC